MKDNTERANNGVEVYANKLFQLADEYIMERLDGKGDEVQENFRDMIFYMSDHIKKPDNSDIEGLDNLFDAYTRLCVRYYKLPTIQCFSWLAKIHRSTFDDWENGEYRASTIRTDTIRKWKDVCKSFVIDELSNNSATNVNLIFISKACYGLRETSPVPAIETKQNQTRTPEQIMEQYGQGLSENGGRIEMPELPE